MGLPRKHVHFPEDEESLVQIVGEIPNREDFPAEEIEALFFTKLEYQGNRQVSKRISRECERLGISKKLQETYCEKNHTAQEHLNAWALQGHERRGLERWANRDHGEKRQQEQFQAIMTVLQAQDEMLASREGKVDHEKLRKVAHKATKVARHFARMMGKADAFAAANDEVLASAAAAAVVSSPYYCDDQTVATDVSSSATEVTEDNISLPRILHNHHQNHHNHHADDDLADSQHISTKSKTRLYNRLPNFLQRNRGRGGNSGSSSKGSSSSIASASSNHKQDALLHSKVKVRES